MSITGEERSEQDSIDSEKQAKDSVTRLTDAQALAIATSGMSQDPPSSRRAPLDDESWADARVLKAWYESPEFVKLRRQRRLLLIALLSILAATICLTFTLVVLVRTDWRNWSPLTFSGLVVAACIAWFWLLVVRNSKATFHLLRESYLADANARDLPSQERLPDRWLTDPDLQNLIILNRTQIGVYQDIATGDAKRAARNCQVAMSFGFLILIVGAVTAIRTSDATSKIVVGALASLGSILSGYIGQTFLKAQDHAMKQLNYYFRQPLVTSYMLAAERLTLKLSGNTRESVVKDLIKNILVTAGRAEDFNSTPSTKPRRRYRPRSTAESSATIRETDS
jgi:hypothetical protein